jgi:hypothetical protein
MIDGGFDLLPEEVDWRDEGCEAFSSCLNCPLPRCLEEQPRGQQKLRMKARDGRMVELRRGGKSVKAIADLFRVSQRTVQRALKSKKPEVKVTGRRKKIRRCHREGREPRGDLDIRRRLPGFARNDDVKAPIR